MIVESPIDLELTQLSGQTSQPPWCEVDGTFSNVVDINCNPVIFNVRQSDDFLDFNYSGNVSHKQAIDKLNAGIFRLLAPVIGPEYNIGIFVVFPNDLLN